MGGGKTEKWLAELGVKRRLCTFCGKDGGLDSRCMDGSSGPSMVHPRKGLWGFPCTKLATALSKKSLLRSVERNMQASSLALKSKQVFLQLGGYGVFPRGRKYETKGLAHLTSQLS